MFIACSQYECQEHNLCYVNNTAEMRGGLRGMLREECRADVIRVGFLIIPKQVAVVILIQKNTPIYIIKKYRKNNIRNLSPNMFDPEILPSNTNNM